MKPWGTEGSWIPHVLQNITWQEGCNLFNPSDTTFPDKLENKCRKMDYHYLFPSLEQQSDELIYWKSIENTHYATLLSFPSHNHCFEQLIFNLKTNQNCRKCAKPQASMMRSFTYTKKDIFLSCHHVHGKRGFDLNLGKSSSVPIM